MTTAQGETRAFTWANGQMSTLSNPNGGSQVYAASVNSSGAVAGFVANQGQVNPAIWTATGNGVAAPLLLQSISDTGGIDVTFNDVRLQSFQGQANAINDRNNSAGMWVSEDGSGRAYCLVDGQFVDMGVLQGGTWASAYGISDAGMVIGTGENARGQMRAWRYVNGRMQELGTLGGSQSYASAISQNGVIAGHATTSNGYLQAYRYQDNRMQGLGTLGGTNSSAYGVNSNGAVVGNSSTYQGGDAAFIFSDGQLYNLNRLVQNATGWTLTAAYGINDQGQIVGEGIFEGEKRAFLLNPLAIAEPSLQTSSVETTPVPEPATLVSFGIGIGLIALGRIRGRQKPPTSEN